MNGEPLDSQRRHLRRRRRRIKRFLGAALVIMLAVICVAVVRSFRHRNAAVKRPAALPADVNRRLSGYTFTRSEEGRQVFTIHAARTLAYGPGASTVLEDVHVIIFGRQGNRHDEVQAKRCNYDSKSGALACAGSALVKLQSQPGLSAAPDFRADQPLFIQTSDVRYDPHQFLIETDQPVHFRFGPATGSAKGLRYSTRDGWLSLTQNIFLQTPVAGGAAGGTRVTAGKLHYERREITLNGGVDIRQAARQIAASDGKLFLDSRNRLTRIALAGSVHGSVRGRAELVTGSADTAEANLDPTTRHLRAVAAHGSVELNSRSVRDGTVRHLRTEEARLRLNPEGDPQAGSVSGGFAVETEGARPRKEGKSATSGGGRVFTGSQLAFGFRPGGVLRDAHTVGPGKIVLAPKTPAEPQQTITAGNFRFIFSQRGQLERLLGASGTSITVRPVSGLPKRSTAQNLNASLDPATGAIRDAVQQGDFRFQHGDERATANEAQYRANGQDVALTGNPQVWNADGRVRARRIILDSATSIAVGTGKVESIHFPRPGNGASGPATGSKSAPPLVVLADNATVNRNDGRAHYSGHVRAWRGADVIEAPSLDVERRSQQVIATGGVTTSFIQEPSHTTGAHGGATPAAPEPVTIRAQRLMYSNSHRTATYQGGVEMRSGTTSVQCRQLTAYLSSAAQPELERAVATGNVRLVQLPGRRGRGERAEYFAQGGKIVLTGGPPVVYDEQQGLLTGQELTFYIHDASLFANGGKASQTLSKRRVPSQ